jgi:UDP-N-acetyl-D-glucosamine dehydrogenase
MNYKKSLINKIKTNKAVIGVIGAGYVGLPLIKEFLQNDFVVYGFDNDPKKIKNLKEFKSYINYINLSKLKIKHKINFHPTSDYRHISKLDVIIICLPTPLTKLNTPDMSYINNALRELKNFLQKGQLLILESTTYPGTTKEIIIPVINKLKYNIGSDFFISYSPERQDPGNKDFDLIKTPKLVSGATNNCRLIASLVYGKIVKRVVEVKTLEIAELTKLYENIYRSINIGLVNEMKIISDKLGINIYDVIDAASTKPFGFSSFYPGPGLGGHCIPIDPYYLSWIANKNNTKANFIELSAKINNSMPKYVVNKIFQNLNKNKVKLKESKILLLGASYKKNVDDPRESPFFKILKIIKSKVGLVKYSDPFIPYLKASRNYNFKMKSIKITKEELKKFDCVALITDHDNFPYKLIEKYSKSIVDCRGKFKNSNNKITPA